MRFALFAAAAALLSTVPPVLADINSSDGVGKISGPNRHDNLAVYFVHGKGVNGPVPLTLAEALAQGRVRVDETGNVNDLTIEAIGQEAVFIQAGDIVKGGQQDRVLMSSLLVTPGSGKVSVASFCVESGRWAKRGAEDSKQFSSASEALPSRVAKLILNAAPGTYAEPETPRTLRGPDAVRQQTVGRVDSGRSDTSARQKKMWDEVAGMQAKLKTNSGSSVSSEASATSLQLSLENKRVQELRAAYSGALENAPEAGDIVGFVIAINGRISSAEVYPSNGLFRKMWPKMLAAAATEAVAHKDKSLPDSPASDGLLKISDVEGFIANSRTGAIVERDVAKVSRMTHIESKNALYVEARTVAGAWYHRSYVAK